MIRRLENLEQKFAASQACRTCGALPAGAKLGIAAQFGVVTFQRIAADAPPMAPCPECGKLPIVFRLFIGPAGVNAGGD